MVGEVDSNALADHEVRPLARAFGGTPADITVSVFNRARHAQQTPKSGATAPGSG